MIVRTVHVFLAGVEEKKEMLLSALPLLNYCELNFHFSDDALAAEASSADLLIVAHPKACVSTLLRGLKEHARLILCISPEEYAALSPKDIENCFEIWFSSASNEQFAAQFSRAIKRFESEEASWFKQNLFTTMTDNIPELVWVKDTTGKHLMVNNSFCGVVEKSKEDIEGRGHYYIWDITPEEYSQGEFVCMESEEEVIAKGEVCVFDESVRCKNGMHQFVTHKMPVRNHANEIVATLGMAHDVTDFANLSNQLSLLINSIPFGVLVVDDKNSIVICNTGFCKLFNMPKDTVVGRNYEDVTSAKLHILQKTDNGFDAEFILHGQKFIYSCIVSDIYDVFENNVGKFFLCYDITSARNLEALLRESAERDPLTEVHNRRYLKNYLEKTADDAIHTILLFDLNDFKIINDNRGHQFGDFILHTFAFIMRSVFEDWICVRMGGDEFLVCKDAYIDDASVVSLLDDMFAKLDAFNAQKLMPYKLDASVGIAQSEKAIPWDTLYEKADSAMYFAKQRKMHYSIFTDGMKKHSVSK